MANPTDGHGVYENVVPASTLCNARLVQIASGGFKLVINYNILYGHISDLLNYATLCQNNGLKIIWSINNTAIWLPTTSIATTFPQLYADSGNLGTTVPFITWLVNQVKSHPATWGYYIGDEQPSANHSAMQTYAAAVLAADPTHPRLIIQGGSIALGTDVFSDCADAMGDDYYTVGDDQSGTVEATYGPGTVGLLNQNYASANNVQSAIALQGGFSWQQAYPPARVTYYPANAPYPTKYQMRFMRDAALANMTPRLVLWYAYYRLMLSDNPPLRFNDLAWAANGLLEANEAIIAQDTVLRPDQANWGTASDGETWTHTVGSATVSVLENRLKLTGSASTQISTLGTQQVQDVTLFVRTTYTASNDYTGFVARYVDINNCVRVLVGNNTLQILVYVAGSPTTLLNQAMTITPGTNYLVRFQAFRNTYAIKVWADGTNEPASYQYTVVDPVGTATKAGLFGMYTLLTTSTDAVYSDSFVAIAPSKISANTKPNQTTPIVWYQQETLPVLEVDIYNVDSTQEVWTIPVQASQISVMLYSSYGNTVGTGTVAISQQNTAVIQYQFSAADLAQQVGSVQMFIEAALSSGTKVYPPIPLTVVKI